MTLEPKKDNLREWVKDLRSGEFAQTTGKLFREEPSPGGSPAGHCCLGVACRTFTRVTGRAAGLHDRDFLPRQVQEWLGLPSADPVVGQGQYQEQLRATEANDDLRWDFNTIADAVENYYSLKEDAEVPA